MSKKIVLSISAMAGLILTLGLLACTSTRRNQDQGQGSNIPSIQPTAINQPKDGYEASLEKIEDQSSSKVPNNSLGVNQVGFITGWLCYPSEDIPPMTIYARNIETQETFSIHVANDNKYEIKVPIGNYIVFAWTDAGVFTPESKGGVYSCYSQEISKKIYPNKPLQGCKDAFSHQPIVFVVKSSDKVTGISICDFYTNNIPNP